MNPDRFPRSAKYNPEWVAAGISGSANPLWMAEWLAEAMALKPGMRVLDLGCGRALSSIFLNREFGVRVWAADLWFGASENARRIQDAGAADEVFAIHANARALPFGAGFFDAIVSLDSFSYYGTDDLYLGYLARLLKPGGFLGIAGAGLVQEMEAAPPEHLRGWWTQDLWCLHSAEWWRRHWERTGIVTVETADTMTEGWKLWLDWHRVIAPENHVELQAVSADEGRTIGYVRVVARRGSRVTLDEPIEKVSTKYVRKPLLREA